MLCRKSGICGDQIIAYVIQTARRVLGSALRRVPPSDTPPLDAHSLSVQSLDPHSVPCHTEELPAYDRVTYGVYIYLDVSCNNRVVAQSNSKA